MKFLRKAFTLIELVVVLIIVSILISMTANFLPKIIETFKLKRAISYVQDNIDYLKAVATREGVLSKDSLPNYLAHKVDVWGHPFYYKVGANLADQSVCVASHTNLYVCLINDFEKFKNEINNYDPNNLKYFSCTSAGGDLIEVAAVLLSSGKNGNIQTPILKLSDDECKSGETCYVVPYLKAVPPTFLVDYYLKVNNNYTISSDEEKWILATNSSLLANNDISSPMEYDDIVSYLPLDIAKSNCPSRQVVGNIERFWAEPPDPNILDNVTFHWIATLSGVGIDLDKISCVLDFNDGNVTTYTGFNKCLGYQTKTHAYSQAGVYTPVLKIYDDQGNLILIKTTNVYVKGGTGGCTVDNFKAFVLDNGTFKELVDASSKDAYANTSVPATIRYAWNITYSTCSDKSCFITFGDGTTQKFSDCSSIKEVIHTYQYSGDYVAKLFVGCGCESNKITLSIRYPAFTRNVTLSTTEIAYNPPPNIVYFSVNPTYGQAPQSININYQITDVNDTINAKIIIDGNKIDTCQASGTNSISKSCSYTINNPGIHSVYLAVTDGHNNYVQRLILVNLLANLASNYQNQPQVIYSAWTPPTGQVAVIKINNIGDNNLDNYAIKLNAQSIIDCIGLKFVIKTNDGTQEIPYCFEREDGTCGATFCDPTNLNCSNPYDQSFWTGNIWLRVPNLPVGSTITLVAYPDIAYHATDNLLNSSLLTDKNYTYTITCYTSQTWTPPPIDQVEGCTRKLAFSYITDSSESINDFQMKIDISDPSLKVCLSDLNNSSKPSFEICSDDNCLTKIPYCFETNTGECKNETLDWKNQKYIWVKIPFKVEPGQKFYLTLKQVPENEEKLNVNGDGVFKIYDDFDNKTTLDLENTWFVYRANNDLQNECFIDNNTGELYLTTNNSNLGCVLYPKNILNLNSVDNYTIEVRYKIGGGSGADGIGLIFGTDKITEASIGSTLGVNPVSLSSGYILELDTYKNTYDPADQYIGLADITSYVTNKGYQSILSYNPIQVRDNKYHILSLKLYNKTTNTFNDGAQVLNNIKLNQDLTNIFGISGSTSNLTDNHVIDWIRVRKTIKGQIIQSAVVNTANLTLYLPPCNNLTDNILALVNTKAFGFDNFRICKDSNGDGHCDLSEKLEFCYLLSDGRCTAYKYLSWTGFIYLKVPMKDFDSSGKATLLAEFNESAYGVDGSQWFNVGRVLLEGYKKVVGFKVTNDDIYNFKGYEFRLTIPQSYLKYISGSNYFHYFIINKYSENNNTPDELIDTNLPYCFEQPNGECTDKVSLYTLSRNINANDVNSTNITIESEIYYLTTSQPLKIVSDLNFTNRIINITLPEIPNKDFYLVEDINPNYEDGYISPVYYCYLQDDGSCLLYPRTKKLLLMIPDLPANKTIYIYEVDDPIYRKIISNLTIWVKSDISAGETYYLTLERYTNKDNINIRNGKDIFELYEDFNGNYLDEDYWNIEEANLNIDNFYKIENGIFYFLNESYGSVALFSRNTFENLPKFKLEVLHNILYLSNNVNSSGGFGFASNNEVNNWDIDLTGEWIGSLQDTSSIGIFFISGKVGWGVNSDYLNYTLILSSPSKTEILTTIGANENNFTYYYNGSRYFSNLRTIDKYFFLGFPFGHGSDASYFGIDYIKLYQYSPKISSTLDYYYVPQDISQNYVIKVDISNLKTKNVIPVIEGTSQIVNYCFFHEDTLKCDDSPSNYIVLKLPISISAKEYKAIDFLENINNDKTYITDSTQMFIVYDTDISLQQRESYISTNTITNSGYYEINLKVNTIENNTLSIKCGDNIVGFISQPGIYKFIAYCPAYSTIELTSENPGGGIVYISSLLVNKNDLGDIFWRAEPEEDNNFSPIDPVVEIQGISHELWAKIYNPNSINLINYQIQLNNIGWIKEHLGLPENGSFYIKDENDNPIDYCFEQPNGECNQTPNDNKIWIKLSLTAYSSKWIKFIPYTYSTGLPAGLSNGDNVFDFYDDFNSDSLDTSKWQVEGDLTYTLDNGILTIKSQDGSGYLQSQLPISNSFILEQKVSLEYYYNVIGWWGPRWKRRIISIPAYAGIEGGLSGLYLFGNYTYRDYVILNKLNGETFVSNSLGFSNPTGEKLLKFILNTRTNKISVYINDQKISNFNLTDRNYYLKYSGYNTKIDWIKVRKYVPNIIEPFANYELIPSLENGYSVTCKVYNIYNPTNQTLGNFQLNINDPVFITSNNKYLFLNSFGKVLPYCFENSYGECKQENTDVKSIWLKADIYKFGNLGNNIIAYKLDFNKNLALNGNKIFDFYDDFEEDTIENWIIYENPKVSIDCTIFGRCVFYKEDGCDPSGVYKALDKTINYPFILEASLYRNELSTCPCNEVGLIDLLGNGYGTCECFNDDASSNVTLDIRTNYGRKLLEKVSISNLLNKWYKTYLAWDGKGNFIIRYFDISTNQLLKEFTIKDVNYNEFSNIYIFGGYPYYVDWIRVRKYNPNITIIGH